MEQKEEGAGEKVDKKKNEWEKNKGKKKNIMKMKKKAGEEEFGQADKEEETEKIEMGNLAEKQKRKAQEKKE